MDTCRFNRSTHQRLARGGDVFVLVTDNGPVGGEDVSAQPATRTYGVKLVRGPFLRLDPHPDACESVEDLLELCQGFRHDDPDAVLVADLFSGAGGLSLGLEQAGLRVVVSVDHDREALETHRHHFPGLSVDWDLADAEVVERVAALMTRCGIEVLAGGPPCQPFSKAGRSLIRHRVRAGLRDPHDQRRDLWRSFLEVARLARPRVVLMENVPDMALDKEMFILRSVILDLEKMGYTVSARVVDTWRYGVPQFRQRLIVVGTLEGASFSWPAEVPQKVTVANAISDLPPIDGGWRPPGGADGWADYDGPRTTFQEEMRSGVKPAHRRRLYDHITRPVRADDAAAFELMDTTTKYSDLPEQFKRYRDDIFDDKYKRLDGNDLSRTITAHIAKDGYWYIHPEQNRTLTVREAARLQTFPDHYRFAGPPTSAFRQIGNAVPPRLGRELGSAILRGWRHGGMPQLSGGDVSELLADWFDNWESRSLPWLAAKTRWQVVAAEILLDRATTATVRSFWPIVERWTQPSQTTAAVDDLTQIGEWIARSDRAQRLFEVAQDLSANNIQELDDDSLAALVVRKVVTQAQADIAAIVADASLGSGSVGEEAVVINKGVLRVAARYFGEPVDRRNRLTDGRIAIARLISYGERSRTAHLGLMELSNSLCLPSKRYCELCPLSASCHGSRVPAAANDSGGKAKLTAQQR